MVRLQSYWRIGIAAGFVLATFWLILRADALESLSVTFRQLQINYILILILLFGAMRLVQGLSLKWVMKIQKVSLDFSQSLELAALKGFYNLGLSGAGLIAQAVRARSENLFTLTQLAWATLLMAMLLISVQGGMLALSFLMFVTETAVMLVALAIGLAAALLPIIALYLLQYDLVPMPRFPASLRKPLLALGAMIQGASAGEIALAWLIQALLVVLRIGRIVFIVYALDPQAAMGILIAITLAADLATVIPVTPGGIGVREFLIGVGGGLSGNFDLFMAAAIIDRGVTLGGNLVHGAWVLAGQFFRNAYGRS